MKFACYISILLSLVLLGACSKPDPMQEIDALVAENKIVPAKKKFKELVESESNPDLERQYIRFLWDHRQYRDFIKYAETHLRQYPDDSEIKHLEFEYYAKLAMDAERQEDFATALGYIVSKLLSPDYQNYRKWESRQTTVFKKWFNKAKESDDIVMQKKVLVQMKYLGFDNLAQSLAPDLYNDLEAVTEQPIGGEEKGKEQ